MTITDVRQQLIEQGYAVVEGVVPKGLVDDVIEAIHAFAGADIESNPERFDGLGIVPLHHHPALWAVRQCEELHAVFASVYGRPDLWVTMDRAGYKPPHEAGSQHPVHWDCDPWTFDGFGVQGVVYLTDTAPEQGAFACVPSIYKKLDVWRLDHAGDQHRRHPDIGAEPLVRVPGPAGSLVLFHRLMPHTNTVNTSEKPRLAQYVTMSPEGGEEERAVRVRDFEEKRPPDWALRQKVPGQLVPEPFEPARLSELGRKLVGLDRW